MECYFCGTKMPEIDNQDEFDAAIDAGWEPYHFRGDEEVNCPVCPTCAGKHCHREDGELVLNGTNAEFLDPNWETTTAQDYEF